MSTPRVTEIPLPMVRTERDDFAEVAETDRDRIPERVRRMAPYDRATEREMIRASLAAELHTHSYDRESR